MGGCTDEITSEHYISRALLRGIHAQPIVSGMPFLDGTARRISVRSLASNVLCAAHNSGLSSADSAGTAAFASIARCESSLRDSVRDNREDWTLVGGPELEAWMGKTVLGGMAAGIFGAGGDRITAWLPEAESAFLEYVFHGAPLPLSMRSRIEPAPERHGAAANLVIEPATRDGLLTGVVFEFQAIRFAIGLGGHEVSRPSVLTMTRLGDPARKGLLVGWPEGEGQGRTVSAVRTGQMDGWDQRR
jgi:hypothetical protein